MVILFLEDDDERIKKARQALIGHTVFFAKTAVEAIEELGKRRFDLASLDHDLGGQVMVESGDDTGFAVAKYIAEMPFEMRPERIIIHSFNPVGAENMVNVLNDAGVSCYRCPFGGDAWWRWSRS